MRPLRRGRTKKRMRLLAEGDNVIVDDLAFIPPSIAVCGRPHRFERPWR